MDKYDEAVAYLTEHPGEIEAAWREDNCGDGPQHPAHCLFTRVTPTGRQEQSPESLCLVGCLTQIRNTHVAWTAELTKAIRADNRIPRDPEGITPKTLPIFRDWQRRIDKELGR